MNLLPCPLCGNAEAYVMGSDNAKAYWVTCGAECCETNLSPTLQTAADAWNRRDRESRLIDVVNEWIKAQLDGDLEQESRLVALKCILAKFKEAK